LPVAYRAALEQILAALGPDPAPPLAGQAQEAHAKLAEIEAGRVVTDRKAEG
jgi:hypothetical protein